MASRRAAFTEAQWSRVEEWCGCKRGPRSRCHYRPFQLWLLKPSLSLPNAESIGSIGASRLETRLDAVPRIAHDGHALCRGPAPPRLVRRFASVDIHQEIPSSLKSRSHDSTFSCRRHLQESSCAREHISENSENSIPVTAGVQ